MAQPVTAPLAQPPVFGLIAAAETVDDPAVRWSLGTEWESELCQLGGSVALVCAGNTAEMLAADETGGGVVQAPTPFAVFARDECSAMTRGRDWQARVRRRLEATRSFLVAREVWDGALAVAADNAAVTYLAAPGSDAVTAAPVDPVAALACVEEGLAVALFGARGMVHVTSQLLTHLAAARAVELRGQQWQTPNGHVVVPDAGYTGSGPSTAGAPPVADPADATSQWIYGTGPMRVRLGTVEVLAPEDAAAMPAVMDWRLNTIVAWAYQPVLVEWEPCVHVAAEVNVGVCA